MSTEGLNGVKVGDNLVMVTGNRFRDDEPVTVSRVGSKYVYVTLHGQERRERFDRKTGIEEGQRGLRARLLTPEQYEEKAQRQALFAQLLAAGIEVRHDKRAEMPTQKLRALLAVMTEDAADRDTEK
ncbi:hypothetical protein ACIBAI_28600 [Streptomyces sp. NPDC051041]|uniref:beta barrel domain-containing protein n=1 Tax=Streptomyces sp. NPDC051041 TaxID=3365640 RepID=UPI0037B09CAC